MAVGAIIKSRSVNLTRMATVMDSDAKIDSRIRRLKRFICQTQICKAALARFILKTGEPLNLVLDRTHLYIDTCPCLAPFTRVLGTKTIKSRTR